MKSGSFSQVDGLAETSWAKEIAERHEAWDRDLPDEAEGLWDFLLGLDEASRKALFAHCVSLTLNAVVEPWNRRAKALEHVDVLGRSLQFDMVDAGWTPTVEFLGRLTKARILQAVREARGADSAQLIDHMKKDIMAREAARLLEGSNWLPEPLRVEVDEVSADAGDAAASEMSDEAALDGDAAELPAFLADDADPSSNKPVTIDSDEADHLQAAE